MERMGSKNEKSICVLYDAALVYELVLLRVG